VCGSMGAPNLLGAQDIYVPANICTDVTFFCFCYQIYIYIIVVLISFVID
jgi:hypothetical protein